MVFYALATVGYYVWSLTRSTDQGGQWATVGQVAIFGVLIAGGFGVFLTRPPTSEELRASFQLFLESGGQGLVRAMGYTFIALQGFDLIAAVGGEVKRPEQSIPRAMFLSLGVALLIYLPLLFLIVAVGSPGRPIAALAGENPEILVAVAARNFLGPAGYWLIVVAGVLAMLSALHANLLAMASDRMLPRWLDHVTPGQGTPVRAVQLTGVTVAFLLIAVPDVATAGAISGLIFLVSFTLVHCPRDRVSRSKAGG
jgi:APA family basic amino acid/polyamine antiporter